MCLFSGLFLDESDNLATVVDAHHLRDLSVISAALLDHSDDFHAGQNTSENDMFIVQVRRWYSGDEELRAVRVFARIRHRQ